ALCHRVQSRSHPVPSSHPPSNGSAGNSRRFSDSPSFRRIVRTSSHSSRVPPDRRSNRRRPPCHRPTPGITPHAAHPFRLSIPIPRRNRHNPELLAKSHRNPPLPCPQTTPLHPVSTFAMKTALLI